MFINKIKFFCFLALQLATLFVFAQGNIKEGEFSLKGQVVGLDSGGISMYYQNSDKKWVSDFMKIEDRQFIDKGHINRPTLAYLVSNVYVGDKKHQNRGLIVLEPGNLQVQLMDGAFNQAKVTGSEGQKLYEQLNLEDKLFGNEFKKSKDLATEPKTTKTNEYAAAEPITPRDSNMLLLSISYDNKVDYIQPNRKSIVSIALLPSLVKNNIISLDSASAILSKLPSPYKLLIEDAEATLIHLLQAAPRQSSRERFLPRILATDSKGNALNTYDYLGKYLVVCFWSSGSNKSKEVNAQLSRLFDKYQGKNIEFLGISKDKNRQVWLDAIDKNGIGKWRNISFSDELDYKNKNKLNKRFEVYSYPTVLLYDRSSELIYDQNRTDYHGYLNILESMLDNLLNK